MHNPLRRRSRKRSSSPYKSPYGGRSGTSDAVADTTGDIALCCIISEVFDGPGDCFIATAANHDDVTAPQVTVLRAYRDQRLARHASGRLFTTYYYRYGRYGARLLRRYPALKPVVRVTLEPLVILARRRIV